MCSVSVMFCQKAQHVTAALKTATTDRLFN